jgi:hypothetical protein
MSLQFDGNGQVNITAGGFDLVQTSAWTWIMEEVEYKGDNKLLAGDLDNSGPYIGWLSGKFSIRVGSVTGVNGPFTIGQFYRIEISNNGAGVITVNIPGVGSSTGSQNALSNFDVFGKYSNGLPFDGLVGKKWELTNTSVGSLSYNFEQPENATVLVEDLQALNGTLSGFTTGGFGVPQSGDEVPVITLLGTDPITITQGDAFTDPGATALDAEDGDITADIVIGGDVVDENVIAQYTITYDVQDSFGNNAVQVTRVVDVVSASSETITITSVVEGQSIKRDVNGQVTFTIAGDIVNAVGPVEYRLDSDAWQVLDAGTGTTFTGNVIVTNQQDVEVRLQALPAVTDTVRYLSAALTIAIGPLDQSNGAGRGTNLQNPTYTPGQPLPTMYRGASNGFTLLNDPTSFENVQIEKGSIWPHYAKLFSDAGIPVCICNLSIGGTTASQWDPLGTRYPRVDDFAAAVGGLSYVITLIGESDAAASTSKATFKAEYLDAANQINLDYGCDVYCVDFPVGTSLGGVTDPRVVTIREANDELVAENAYIKFGGDLSVIDINNDGDTLHITQDAGLIQAAQIINNAVLGIASSLTVTFTGAPDGDYDFVYWDASAAVVLSTPIEVVTVSILGGEFTTPTLLDPATNVVGFIAGDNPPTTGGAIYGVTV